MPIELIEPEIYQKALIATVSFIIGNRLAIGRDRRKEFNSVTYKVRELINMEISTLSDNIQSINYNMVSELEKIDDFIPFYKRKCYQRHVKNYAKKCENSTEIFNGTIRWKIDFSVHDTKKLLKVIKKYIKLK